MVIYLVHRRGAAGRVPLLLAVVTALLALLAATSAYLVTDPVAAPRAAARPDAAPDPVQRLDHSSLAGPAEPGEPDMTGASIGAYVP